jgi:arsenate reductase
MKKIFFLSTCNTCKKIMDQISNLNEFEIKDIKTEAITESEIDYMHNLAGSYDALFSKIAMKYRSLKLNEIQLSEADMRDWILKEYTFLKRPVVIIEDKIFIGSSKSTVKSMLDSINM